MVCLDKIGVSGAVYCSPGQPDHHDDILSRSQIDDAALKDQEIK
jgi:hypothetical protein